MGDPLNRDDEVRVANAVASALISEGLDAYVHEPRHFFNVDKKTKQKYEGYSIPMVDVLTEDGVYRLMVHGPIIGPTTDWVAEREVTS